MKLYEKEAAVLAAIAVSNSLNAEKLAKITGFKTHTVRYNLSLLIEKKVIFKSVLFNPSVLGYQTFNIFFAVPPSKRLQILKFLKTYPLVSWLAENSGEAPYEITCLVRHVGEVEDLVQEVSNKFNFNLMHKEWAAETEQNFYGYKHLTKGKEKPSPLTIGWTTKQFSCDEVDSKIIGVLRSSPHSSDAYIAKVLNLPSSTLLYRTGKLRSSGVIAADRVFIDPIALGLLEVQLLVILKNFNTEQIAKFREYVEKHPAVIAMIRCFGSWDFKLVAQVQIYADLFELQDNLLQVFPELIKSLRLIPRRKLYQIAPICPGI